MYKVKNEIFLHFEQKLKSLEDDSFFIYWGISIIKSLKHAKLKAAHIFADGLNC